MMNEEKTQKQDNYERLIFAIALFYSAKLEIDISKVSDYSQLTEALKVFALKILELHPDFLEQADSDERLSEKQIVTDTSKLAMENGNGNVFATWQTAGDGKVCERCKLWEGKTVCIAGDPRGNATLDLIMKSGALHYGCKCILVKDGSKVAANQTVFSGFTSLVW